MSYPPTSSPTISLCGSKETSQSQAFTQLSQTESEVNYLKETQAKNISLKKKHLVLPKWPEKTVSAVSFKAHTMGSRCSSFAAR